MRISLGWLLLVIPILSADTPSNLQGAWRLASAEAEDGPQRLPDARPTIEINGDRVLHGGEEVARLVADSGTTPMVIDLKFAADKVYEGVYVIEKDALRICVNGRSDGLRERPQDFKLEGTTGRRLLKFERIKPDDLSTGNGFVGVQLRSDQDRKVIVVDATFQDGPAAKAGLKKGDVVLEIGATAISELLPAVDAVRRASPKSELTLRVRRGDKEETIRIRVGQLPLAVLLGLE